MAEEKKILSDVSYGASYSEKQVYAEEKIQVHALHSRLHPGQKPFKCHLCSKAFTRNYYLQVHMRIHTGEKPFKCSFCSDEFTRRDGLNRHMKKHDLAPSDGNVAMGTGSHFFGDAFAAYAASFNEELERRNKSCYESVTNGIAKESDPVASDDRKPCTDSSNDDNFAVVDVLVKEEEVSEAYCVSAVRQPRELDASEDDLQLNNTGNEVGESGKARENSHDWVESNDCPAKDSVDVEEVVVKVEVSPDISFDPAYAQEVADKQISRNEFAVGNSTEIERHPFQCFLCNKILSGKLYLARHLLLHTGIRPFKCQHCEKTFTRNFLLQDHLRTHTGERPFICQHCSKAFTQRPHLNAHLKIHNGDKSFKCHVCDKAFTLNGHLKGHLKIHTGEKPYKCSVCGKEFSERTNLQMHFRIHTGEKPFKCEHCGKAFSRNFLLIDHLRIHSGEKPFECGICFRAFNRKFHFQRHQRTHAAEGISWQSPPPAPPGEGSLRGSSCGLGLGALPAVGPTLNPNEKNPVSSTEMHPTIEKNPIGLTETHAINEKTPVSYIETHPTIIEKNSVSSIEMHPTIIEKNPVSSIEMHPTIIEKKSS